MAAGLVPFAIGSETSGSIVTPASYCGVTALRPTYGLVSRHGAMALSWTLDKLGPFAPQRRRLRPGPAGDRGQGRQRPRLGGQELLLHAAVCAADEGSEGRLSRRRISPIAPSRRRARHSQAALEVLQGTPASQLVETKLPQFPYGAVLATILAAEQASIFEPLITSGKVDQLADQAQIAGLEGQPGGPRQGLPEGHAHPAPDSGGFRRLFARSGCAGGAGTAGPGHARSISRLDRRPEPPPPAATALPGFHGIIPAGNLAGLPALVLPCGFSPSMPVALQLVGAPFSENTLLAIGSEFQARTDWHKRRPPGVF